MALPKALIKKHAGNLKKAWAEFRSRSGRKKQSKSRRRPAAKAAAKAPRKTSKKRRSAATVAKTKGKRMARRGGRRAKAVGKAIIASQPAQMVGGVAVATAGAVGTSVAINKLPGVKNLPPLAKSGTQFGLGVVALMFKNPWVKKAGVGMVMAGGMGAARALFKVEPLAGDEARRLSDTEMAAIMGRLGRPVNYQGSLGRPVNYQGSLGRPASPDFHAGWSGGFGSGFGG